MFNWILGNLPTILVGCAVAALLVSVVLRMLRDKRQGKCSCSGCASCPSAGICHKK